jgi:hypothetical protein
MRERARGRNVCRGQSLRVRAIRITTLRERMRKPFIFIYFGREKMADLEQGSRFGLVRGRACARSMMRRKGRRMEYIDQYQFYVSLLSEVVVARKTLRVEALFVFSSSRKRGCPHDATARRNETCTAQEEPTGPFNKIWDIYSGESMLERLQTRVFLYRDNHSCFVNAFFLSCPVMPQPFQAPRSTPKLSKRGANITVRRFMASKEVSRFRGLASSTREGF